MYLHVKKISIISILVLLTACGKEQNASVTFTTKQLSATTTAVNLEVMPNVSGGETINQAGVMYGLASNISSDNLYQYNNEMEYGNVRIASVKGEQSVYTLELTDLYTNADYYYVPFCVVDGKIYEGGQSVFSTNCPSTQTAGPGGGFVIYQDGNGGGIEAAPFDVALFDSESNYFKLCEWGCDNLDVQGTSDTIGAGAANTDSIVSNCPEINQAALLCANFEYGGFDDWYLPSINELALIYSELYAKGDGNFGQLYNNHWSSSQQSVAFAKSFDFKSGAVVPTTSKSNNLFVRPVRSF